MNRKQTKATIDEFDTSDINPSIAIHNLKDNILQLYEIHSKFIILLECFNATDNKCSMHQFTEQGYQTWLIDGNTAKHKRRHSQHQHDFIEIMYVLSGSVTNHVENQIFTYHAGQCCVMNRNICHCEYFSDNSQVVFLCLTNELAKELLDEYNFNKTTKSSGSDNNSIFQLIESNHNEAHKFDKVYLDYFPRISANDILEQIHPLFNLIIQEITDNKPGSGFFIKGAFARFFEILNDSKLYSINWVHSDASSQSYLFTKIKHIMETSHGRCSRKELTIQLHYNGEYLNRISKKFTGMTLLEYGRSIYMEETKRLLLESDKSITTIIDEMGFSNRSHFYRQFKQAFGETPLDYRERQKKSQ